MGAVLEGHPDEAVALGQRELQGVRAGVQGLLGTADRQADGAWRVPLEPVLAALLAGVADANAHDELPAERDPAHGLQGEHGDLRSVAWCHGVVGRGCDVSCVGWGAMDLM